ncbi:4a-hydroxytetrahydrobiopterin dehydratase [Massilia niastensis]|uniref:4a-hydroxytetrahydrobiopterin dehydratase n=1 Tax=Massilia niastensis TaxID=544911 RepID=UPI0005946986|nr:4a-hydroxytetrahydrobiopterin dehydratase [Massilia niastensis]
MKLLDRHCTHGAPALDPLAAKALLADIPHWRPVDGALHRDFSFSSYAATIAFVNAVAAMAEQENHHPEMSVGYRRCGVTWTTHSAGGALSENDFISAAKTDALYARQAGA